MEDFVEVAGSEPETDTEQESLSEGGESSNEQEQTQSSDSSNNAKKKETQQATHSDSRSDSKSSDTRGQAKEGEKAQEEPASDTQKLTPAEVEDISKKLNLPKEIKPFLNKKGDLRFVVPIDGKKYDASLEEVFKGFNLNQAGHRRLQQGKELEQQARAYLTSVKENPDRLWEIAEKNGLDKYELAEQLLKGYVEESSLSPEEKAHRAEIEEAKAIKAENERLKKEQAERTHAEAVAKHRNQMGQELVNAMTEHGFKPFNPNDDPSEQRTKCTIMANAIGKQLLANQHGKQLSIADAVYLSRQEWKENVLSVFDDIDDNHIVDLIPDRIIKAIRKSDVASLTGGTPASTGFGEKIDLEEHNEAPTPRRPRKKQGLGDYFSSI